MRRAQRIMAARGQKGKPCVGTGAMSVQREVSELWIALGYSTPRFFAHFRVRE
jgi:hypothetical protein